VFGRIDPSFRALASEPAATAGQVRVAEMHFGPLPRDYQALIQEVTELELEHQDGQYLRIWGPLGCKEMDEGYGIRARIPDAIPIGDDGGGRVLFYQNGPRGAGLYLVGHGNLDGADATWIARDLVALLGEGSGIDRF
jgi:hypothetical protein